MARIFADSLAFHKLRSTLHLEALQNKVGGTVGDAVNPSMGASWQLAARLLLRRAAYRSSMTISLLPRVSQSPPTALCTAGDCCRPELHYSGIRGLRRGLTILGRRGLGYLSQTLGCHGWQTRSVTRTYSSGSGRGIADLAIREQTKTATEVAVLVVEKATW